MVCLGVSTGMERVGWKQFHTLTVNNNNQPTLAVKLTKKTSTLLIPDKLTNFFFYPYPSYTLNEYDISQVNE